MISIGLLPFTLVAAMIFPQVVPSLAKDSHPNGGAPGQKKKLVLPPWQTLERIREKHGMTDEEFEEVHKNVVLIKTIAYELKYHKKMNESLVAGLDEFIDDTLLTPKQSRYMVELLTERKHRQKRNIINFQKYPGSKWPSDSGTSVVTIPYKFDGNHDAEDETKIQDGLAHWEANTCVRFKKLEANEVYNDHHILFTNEPSGCWSYVGRISTIPQEVNLNNAGCLLVPIIAHELGHALGFFHEHVRPDRDDYVTVLESNIISSKLHNFEKNAIDDVETHGTKYDYSSVMHYGKKSFSNAPWNNIDTLTTKDPLYSSILGQRSGLSFLDIKEANIEYCSDVCPEIPCLNDGYVNPNDCSICKCPDGYGGALCGEVAASDAACPMESAGSDGVIQVTSDVEQCFSLTNYSDGTQCNWKLKADVGCSIDMYFNSSQPFRLFCSRETCQHWIEIKYSGNLTEVGPRFCCEATPNVTLTSEGNEAVVTFRSGSPALASWRVNNSLSFHLCYKLNDAQCIPPNSSTTDSPTALATDSALPTSETLATTAATELAPSSTFVVSTPASTPSSSDALFTPSIVPTDVTATATTSITPTPTSTVPTASSVPPNATNKKPLTKQEKAELTRGRNRIPVRFKKGGVKMCGQLYFFN